MVTVGVRSGLQRSAGSPEAITPRDLIVTVGSNRRKVIRASTEPHPSWPLRLRVLIDRAPTAQSSEQLPRIESMPTEHTIRINQIAQGTKGE